MVTMPLSPDVSALMSKSVDFCTAGVATATAVIAVVESVAVAVVESVAVAAVAVVESVAVAAVAVVESVAVAEFIEGGI